MKKVFILFSCILLATLALTFNGCSKKNEIKEPPHISQAIPAILIDTQWKLYTPYKNTGKYPFTSDTSYAVVNSKWLPLFYKQWKNEMFALDVVRWMETFDCNKFAASFCARAQIEFYRKAFGTFNTTQALAIAEIWYIPEIKTSKTYSAHAIVAAITEKGLVFIEPQTGKELKLSEKEHASIFFKRF